MPRRRFYEDLQPVSHVRLAALLLAVALVAPSLVAAQDRCEGTLCDFYYGGPPTEAQKKAAAKAAATPTPVTPGSTLFGGLFGGGSPPAASGAAPQAAAPSRRCEGTLCDLYYGGPPEERPGDQPAAVAATPVPEESFPSTRSHAYVETPREPELCVGTAKDPWRCFR